METDVERDCYSCAGNAELAAGRALEPRELIAADEYWRVAHAFGVALPGWLVLVPRRHVTSVAELTDAEASLLGVWQVRLSRAMGVATGCVKTYVAQFAEREGFAHVHFHIVPRGPEHPAHLIGPGIFQPSDEKQWLTDREMDEAAVRITAALQ